MITQFTTGGIRRQYLIAVATGYVSMLIHGGSQLFLVPLYLESLGKYQFGVLMMLLGFVNYTGAGVAWLTGGMLRVLGEYSARSDSAAFSKALSILRVGYLVYAAILTALLVLAVMLFGESWFSTALPNRDAVLRGVALCGLYLIGLYDLSVDRVALTAIGRQAAANVLFTLSVIVFVILVIPWLLQGGGLDGIIVCLAAGMFAACLAARIYRKRIGLSTFWFRPDDFSRALLKRVAGPMGAGYFLYGLIVCTAGADVLLVGWLGTAATAAEFVLVWKPAEILIQILWKLPEHSIPYLIRMDAQGEQDRLESLYKRSLSLMTGLSILTGAAYAAFGPWLVQKWVGAAAPDSRLAFLLAGAAVFWLSVARLPSTFSYSTVRLKPLLKVSGTELVGKVALTVALFPHLGYLSPLLSLNLIHLSGIAIAYRRLISGTVPGDVR